MEKIYFLKTETAFIQHLYEELLTHSPSSNCLSLSKIFPDTLIPLDFSYFTREVTVFSYKKIKGGVNLRYNEDIKLLNDKDVIIYSMCCEEVASRYYPINIERLQSSDLHTAFGYVPTRTGADSFLSLKNTCNYQSFLLPFVHGISAKIETICENRDLISGMRFQEEGTEIAFNIDGTINNEKRVFLIIQSLEQSNKNYRNKNRLEDYIAYIVSIIEQNNETKIGDLIEIIKNKLPSEYLYNIGKSSYENREDIKFKRLLLIGILTCSTFKLNKLDDYKKRVQLLFSSVLSGIVPNNEFFLLIHDIMETHLDNYTNGTVTIDVIIKEIEKRFNKYFYKLLLRYNDFEMESVKILLQSNNIID